MRRYSFLFAALMMRFRGAKLQNLFDFSHILCRKGMERRRCGEAALWGGGFLAAGFKFPAADNFFTRRRSTHENWHDENFFVKISKKCLKNVVYVEFLW